MAFAPQNGPFGSAGPPRTMAPEMFATQMGPQMGMGPFASAGPPRTMAPEMFASQMGPGPLASVGPPRTMAPVLQPQQQLASMGPGALPLAPRPDAQQIAFRLDEAAARREDLVTQLNILTNNRFADGQSQRLSLARKEHLDDVDWRVPRLVYCKDPKFNMGLDPMTAYEVQSRKAQDGLLLESALANEAIATWQEKLSHVGRSLPADETVIPGGLPFVQVCPNYARQDDIWNKRLELRTLDEALRGDLTKPLPTPVIFPEEYANFTSGKYVKDDCPIS